MDTPVWSGRGHLSRVFSLQGVARPVSSALGSTCAHIRNKYGGPWYICGIVALVVECQRAHVISRISDLVAPSRLLRSCQDNFRCLKKIWSRKSSSPKEGMMWPCCGRAPGMLHRPCCWSLCPQTELRAYRSSSFRSSSIYFMIVEMIHICTEPCALAMLHDEA